ncbi:MAG: hypothetical protein R3C09_14675 [Pirellulaceae bacterium]
MPFRFPRRTSYGGGIIDAFSFDTLPVDGNLPGDPASVRFRSIAEIMRRGILRFHSYFQNTTFDNTSSLWMHA